MKQSSLKKTRIRASILTFTMVLSINQNGWIRGEISVHGNQSHCQQEVLGFNSPIRLSF